MNAAEDIVDLICTNGGMNLYDEYLKTKYKPHLAKVMIQIFGEGIQVNIESNDIIQFSHFPGDPGEEEE